MSVCRGVCDAEGTFIVTPSAVRYAVVGRPATPVPVVLGWMALAVWRPACVMTCAACMSGISVHPSKGYTDACPLFCLACMVMYSV